MEKQLILAYVGKAKNFKIENSIIKGTASSKKGEIITMSTKINKITSEQDIDNLIIDLAKESMKNIIDAFAEVIEENADLKNEDVDKILFVMKHSFTKEILENVEHICKALLMKGNNNNGN